MAEPVASARDPSGREDRVQRLGEMAGLRAVLESYELAPPILPFALESGGTNNQTFGLRTGAGVYIAKRYHRAAARDALEYEHQLVLRLAQAGLSFAVPAPATARDGATLVWDGDGWTALFPLLAGAPPDPADPAAAAQIGAALGELHRAIAGFEATLRPGRVGYGELRRIHSLVPDPAAAVGESWWPQEFAAVERFAAGAYRDLPRQVIHGDFAPGNTLFSGGRLAAVIDFEFAGADARAIDVAAGLLFTLRPWRGAPAWDTAAELCRGYARFVRLTPDEIAALPELIRLRNIVSAIWHIGQDAALGRGTYAGTARVARARTTSVWLEDNGDRLRALVEREMA